MALERQQGRNSMARIALTLVIVALGGFIFALFGVPLHWMLGPAAALLLVGRFLKGKLYWPVGIRNAALIPIGYTLGTSMTAGTLVEMGRQLPAMLLATVLILLFSFLVSCLVARWTRIPLRSVVTGSIPGGLSQMLVLGEELDGVDATIVTFFQVMRLMGVVFLVPLIALSPFFSGGAEAGTGAASGQGAHWSVGLVWLYLIVTVASAIIGRRIKLPTAYLLGPIIGTSALVIAGTPAPHLPAPLLDIAQIAMGAYLGLMLKPARIAEKGRAVLAAVVTGLALILFSMASAFVLTALHGVSYLTAFIALAPGGMDQMGILAREAHADLAVVTSYQMFRIFFILLVVPPVLKKWFAARWFRWIERWAIHHGGRSMQSASIKKKGL
ncbi:AbrB family transcriptional regulator [Geobacillus sp. LEMMJ02]|uniref:AbrB family transcriptional regulator n=2 Tax=Geobacillus TaxID=129337 RepID=UPI0009EF0F1C|nr:AbrB family transcriptional regulator [Geobacillus sp. LEMMJ02]TRY43595.1 AbrB family transcriptional regulator [Geobacillus sp. LEMMJ02]